MVSSSVLQKNTSQSHSAQCRTLWDAVSDSSLQSFGHWKRNVDSQLRIVTFVFIDAEPSETRAANYFLTCAGGAVQSCPFRRPSPRILQERGICWEGGAPANPRHRTLRGLQTSPNSRSAGLRTSRPGQGNKRRGATQAPRTGFGENRWVFPSAQVKALIPSLERLNALALSLGRLAGPSESRKVLGAGRRV